MLPFLGTSLPSSLDKPESVLSSTERSANYNLTFSLHFASPVCPPGKIFPSGSVSCGIRITLVRLQSVIRPVSASGVLDLSYRMTASASFILKRMLYRVFAVPKYYFFAAFGLFAPYLERACSLLFTPAVSRVPLTMWYLTPGRSLTLPPLIRTTLCSCRLWPIPGM